MESWVNFTINIKENVITLNDEKHDYLCRVRNSLSGNYFVKLGYLELAETKFNGANKWSWPLIWKFHFP